MAFKILKTSSGNWYWHLIAPNGQKSRPPVSR
jgi:uncharacterized protein YegP (UPF0339 family)